MPTQGNGVNFKYKSYGSSDSSWDNDTITYVESEAKSDALTNSLYDVGATNTFIGQSQISPDRISSINNINTDFRPNLIGFDWIIQSDGNIVQYGYNADGTKESFWNIGEFGYWHPSFHVKVVSGNTSSGGSISLGISYDETQTENSAKNVVVSTFNLGNIGNTVCIPYLGANKTWYAFVGTVSSSGIAAKVSTAVNIVVWYNPINKYYKTHLPAGA